MKINQILPAMLAICLLFLIVTVSAEETEVIGGDMGIYRVHCNVDGARVYFDGELKGEIEGGILDVPVYTTGTPYRNYTVEKEGYRTYTGPINSVPAKGQIINIYVTLNANPIVEYGQIRVLGNPTLANVTLDAKPAGFVPPSGVLILYNVVPGEHRVGMTKKGYLPNTTYVFIEPNQILKVSITLAPMNYGTISVTSVPEGANVNIDNQYMGVTPIVLQDILPGSHTVMLQLSGYQDYTTIVDVNGDTPAELNANLVVVPSTGPTKIPLSLSSLFGALAAITVLIGIRRK